MQEIQKLSKLLQEIQDIACVTHEAVERTGVCPLRDFESGIAGHHRAYDEETRFTVLWQMLIYTLPRFELQARFQLDMSKNTTKADAALIVRQIRSSAPRIWSYRRSYESGFVHTDFGPRKHKELAIDGCLLADGRIVDDAHIYALGWTLTYNDKIYLICADELDRDLAFSIEILHPFPKHLDDDEFWEESFTSIIEKVYGTHRLTTFNDRLSSVATDYSPESLYARLQCFMNGEMTVQSRNTPSIHATVAMESGEEIVSNVNRRLVRFMPTIRRQTEVYQYLFRRYLEANGCDESGEMPHAHRSLLMSDPLGLLCLSDDELARLGLSPRDTIKQALSLESVDLTCVEDAFAIYMHERRWLASFPCMDLSVESHAMKFGIPYDDIKLVFSPELLEFRVPIAPQGEVLKQFQTKYGLYMADDESPKFGEALDICMSRQFSRTGNMSQIAQWIYKVCDRWRYCKSEIELVTSGMQRRVNKTTQTLLHKGLSQLADIFRSQ